MKDINTRLMSELNHERLNCSHWQNSYYSVIHRLPNNQTERDRTFSQLFQLYNKDKLDTQCTKIFDEFKRRSVKNEPEPLYSTGQKEKTK